MSRRPSHLKLYSLIGIMVVLWSLNYIVAKLALHTFPPLLLACFRVTLAGMFILPVYLVQRSRESSSETPLTGEGPSLARLALFGVALNQLFFVVGLSRTSVAHSALIIALTPVLVLLISGYLGQERITRAKLLGMGIAVAGVAVLNLSPSKSPGASVLGDFLTLMAALTFALFTVFSKKLTPRHTSVTLTACAYLGGALLMAPITIWQASSFRLAAVTAPAWASLIYMALFPSVVCYLIFSYALAHIPASRVSAFSYLQPLVAGAVAVPVLGEAVTSALAAGGALVLAGVCLTERG